MKWHEHLYLLSGHVYIFSFWFHEVPKRAWWAVVGRNQSCPFFCFSQSLAYTILLEIIVDSNIFIEHLEKMKCLTCFARMKSLLPKSKKSCWDTTVKIFVDLARFGSKSLLHTWQGSISCTGNLQRRLGVPSNQILQGIWCKITIENMEDAEIIRKIEQVDTVFRKILEIWVYDQLWEDFHMQKTQVSKTESNLSERCRAMSKAAGRDDLI